jgi:DnaK suppressor protein
MENVRAKELLGAERLRTERLLADLGESGQADRLAANEPGDMSDSAEPLTEQGTDEAVLVGLQERLAAIERAEARLEAGTFGYSVRSGLPISDERLEADPAAELTIEEARQSS